MAGGEIYFLRLTSLIQRSVLERSQPFFFAIELQIAQGLAFFVLLSLFLLCFAIFYLSAHASMLSTHPDSTVATPEE